MRKLSKLVLVTVLGLIVKSDISHAQSLPSLGAASKAQGLSVTSILDLLNPDFSAPILPTIGYVPLRNYIVGGILALEAPNIALTIPQSTELAQLASTLSTPTQVWGVFKVTQAFPGTSFSVFGFVNLGPGESRDNFNPANAWVLPASLVPEITVKIETNVLNVTPPYPGI